MRAIRVGDRTVGEGQPCLIAAEAGINHNGNMNLAHRLIDAAADTGADAIKFQNYVTEDFVSDTSLRYEYLSQGRLVSESQVEMFKRCELRPGAIDELRRHADHRRLLFFATPTGASGLAELVQNRVPMLKNGSDYLVHLELVRAMAATGLPTVLSTGMATLAEIDDAVRAFRAAGGTDLILLHCTSSYPTPPQDVHLRKIPVLADAFDVPVGLSDHTEGSVAAVAAVALGACFIEKHFTLDHGLPGPDQRFSCDPDELRQLASAVRTVEQSLGQSAIVPTAGEDAARMGFRLSCVAATDLASGHRLTKADVAFRRPGSGLLPKHVDSLVGRRLSRAVRSGEVLGEQHFA